MRISVITINYNNGDGLEKTLNSLNNQTCGEFESIVVDGGSNDNSLDVIKKYEGIIHSLVYVSEKDNGIYDAMNKGINMATGDYLIFMNSGDMFFNDESLAMSLPYLQNNKDILSGIGIGEQYVMNPPKESELSLAFFLKSSMNHQSCFIKRELMKKLKYDSNCKIAADSDFFFKALIMNNCSYQDIPVKVCYCEEAGASGELDKSLYERYECIKKVLPARMSSDVDFIIKYHNPINMEIGNVLYNKYLRWLYDKIIRRGRRL